MEIKDCTYFQKFNQSGPMTKVNRGMCLKRINTVRYNDGVGSVEKFSVL